MTFSSLATWLTPGKEKTGAAVQLAQFGMVGSIGFIFDTATVYTLRRALGLYIAGVVGYVVAASINWLLNRHWTFRNCNRHPLHRQWARFLVVNLAGFVLNRGTYSALVASFPLAAEAPVIAVAAGAAAGFGTNFLFSRRFVFR